MEAEVLANLNAMYSGAFSNLINIVGMVIGGLGLFAGFNLYYQNKTNEKAIDSKLKQLDKKLKQEYESRMDEVKNEIEALKFHHGCVSSLSYSIQVLHISDESEDSRIRRLEGNVKALLLLHATSRYDEYVEQRYIDTRDENIKILTDRVLGAMSMLTPIELDECKVSIEKSIAILKGSKQFSELASKIADTYERQKTQIIKDL